MAPQVYIPLAANILGTIGTILWCVQLVPQIWHSYRIKSTDGVPPTMMLLWSLSGVPFGVYSICQNFNIPLQVQPQCFCLFCMVSWGQCMYYQKRWRTWTVTLTCSIALAACAGVQVALVFVLRPRYDQGLSWPVTMIGAIAVVILLSGYVPIPFELMKRRGRVVGMSFWFLLIDSSGALFSLLSLVAQETFDIEFGTLYALCAGIEYSIFISHGIWLLRTRDLRRRAREAGQSFDNYPEAIRWQEGGFKIDRKRILRGLHLDAGISLDELPVAQEIEQRSNTV